MQLRQLKNPSERDMADLCLGVTVTGVETLIAMAIVILLM
jgi:hypothetical protein